MSITVSTDSRISYHPNKSSGSQVSVSQSRVVNNSNNISREEAKITGTSPQQKISVVAVGLVSSEARANKSSKKSSSLLGKLFSKNKKPKQTSSNLGVLPVKKVVRPVSAVTSLEVKSSNSFNSSSVANHHPTREDERPILQTLANSQRQTTADLCTNCSLKPAQVSVADAQGMRTEKLCTDCHVLHQQSRKTHASADKTNSVDELPQPVPQRRLEPVSVAEPSARRTVIVVHDGKGTSRNNSVWPNVDLTAFPAGVAVEKVPVIAQARSDNLENTEKLLKILEEIKSSVLGSAEMKEARLVNSSNTQATSSSTEAVSSSISPAPAIPAVPSVVTSTTSLITVGSKEQLSNVINVQMPKVFSTNPHNKSGSNQTDKTSNEMQAPKQDEGLPVSILTIEGNNKLIRSGSRLEGGGANRNSPTVRLPETTAIIVSMEEQIDFNDDSSSMISSASGASSAVITPRPQPFNPDYRSTFGRSTGFPLEIPPELEANMPFQGAIFQSKSEEILYNNRLAVLLNETDPIAAVESRDYYPPAPPRYEDIIENDKQSSSDRQNLQQVYFLKSFGKFSEFSTQPGGLNDPSTVKFSHYAQPKTTGLSRSDLDVVVVTDVKLSTVQVFSLNGECLALVKVTGVKSCCPIDSRQLVLATDDKVALFDYEGIEKTRISLNSSQEGVNSITALRKRESLIAVAQSKSISIIDCRFSSLVVVKNLTSATPKKPFRKVVDVATTSKEDLVVLDAGASDNTGAIYVIDLTSKQLKSAIYPKHELCGSLVTPVALTVDRHNRIIVSDAGNRRVLLFSVSGKLKTAASTSITGAECAKQIQVKTLSGLRLEGTAGGVYPVGIDVNNDDLIFLAVKGQNFAEIRAYSSH